MNLPLELAAQVEAATGFVKSRWDRSPRFGIILGTGAGELAEAIEAEAKIPYGDCLLYTSPSPRDQRGSRMPSSA